MRKAFEWQECPSDAELLKYSLQRSLNGGRGLAVSSSARRRRRGN